MTTKPNVSFQQAIEMVESLPPDQQEDLVDIIQRRIIEKKRDSLAKNVREARAEYKKGKVKKGTVKDLLKDIAECSLWFGATPLSKL